MRIYTVYYNGEGGTDTWFFTKESDAEKYKDRMNEMEQKNGREILYEVGSVWVNVNAKSPLRSYDK